jgi:hypothetical protein
MHRLSVLRGKMIDMRIGSTRRSRTEGGACGYFPELVEDMIMLTLADGLLDFVVHHEPTFNRDRSIVMSQSRFDSDQIETGYR